MTTREIHAGCFTFIERETHVQVELGGVDFRVRVGKATRLVPSVVNDAIELVIAQHQSPTEERSRIVPADGTERLRPLS